MNSFHPVIVDAISNVLRSFPNVPKITVGRNINSSIDIPDPNISRNQCVISLANDNKWTIKDLSSHRTTMLNNKRILDENHVLENGDKITFPCPSVELFFYYGIENVPNVFKKRKSEESEKDSLLMTPSKRSCKINKNKDGDVTGGIEVINLADKSSLSLDFRTSGKLEDFQTLSNEVEKYKQLYFSALEDIAGVKNEKIVIRDELNNAKIELEKLKFQMVEEIAVHTKEIEILKDKLKREEDANEKMLLEIQELNECLKESEQEQMRLAKESNQSEEEAEKESENDKAAAKSTEKDKNDAPESTGKEKEDDYFSALALQKIVDLVEVKWHEVERDQLKIEVKKRDDKITDLTLEYEKRKQEVMDIIDRELLCSICSEVLCNALTLNCRHTFCKACVVEWKKKKRECPVCRARIKSEVQPLVLDSFIDRLFDVIGGELKTRRDEVKAERSNSAMNAPSTSKGNVNSRRGSHQNRTPRRGRDNNLPVITSTVSLLQPQLVIDLREIGHEFIPGNVIDLTTNTPQSRRGRSRSINYYNL